MLPVRMILIAQPQFKAVFKLEVVAVGSELRLDYSVHQFKSVLTDSMIQSFNSNTSNMSFFKSLPVEKVFENQLSLQQCEQLYIYLQNLQNYINTNGTIPQIQLPGINLYLEQHQILAFQNFVLQFGQSYEIIKMNLQILTLRNDKNNQLPQQQSIIPQQTEEIQEPIPEDKIEITENEETVEGDETIILLNDVLKLSPTTMCTYYISKFVSNIFNVGKYEKVELLNQNNAMYLSISPLFNSQYLFTSQYQRATMNIIDSFNYSNNEYISKLKSLINQLVYIINNYHNKPELKKLFIVFKIVEYLIYIYSIKLSPQTFLSKVSTTGKSNVITNMWNTVNYSIDYMMKNYFDMSRFPYNTIVINHFPNVILDEEELELENLKTILVRELYLIDIDRDHFVNRVFEEVTKSSKRDKSAKLILNAPNKIDLKNFVNSNRETSNWLSYVDVKPEQKQFEENKIITEEYLQVLQLINAPSISIGSIIKDLNPIIARYADTIMNVIFKELSSIEASASISTLNLLNNYIRPYLSEDSTVDTELFILYRVVLPYLYDTFGITTFIDYFH